MNNKEEQTVFYGLLTLENWSFYMAATDKGLCFIGSEHAELDELKAWVAKHRPNATLVENGDKIAHYKHQFMEYLQGGRKTFDLPVDMIGTTFQHAVWAELKNIPFGETRTYTEIAKNIGRPKSVRAVGTAIGANPVLIVVPCHRVISKSGKLAGFRGGIPMKETLLALEHGGLV
jgi:O-6-methylguanine DNA methyltransferase